MVNMDVLVNYDAVMTWRVKVQRDCSPEGGV